MTDVHPEVAAATEDATDPIGAARPAPPAEDDTLRETAPEPAPAFRVMDLEDVSLDLPTQYPAVTLVESQPPTRALVFPVGLPEGTAMAQALRRMDSRRPMTHELFMRVLQRARIDVIALRLTGREEGNLLAELDLMTPGVASGSTVGPPTASCWHCACRCRRRSWSTNASSTRPVMSSPSRTPSRRHRPDLIRSRHDDHQEEGETERGVTG